jgi:hypothetical protein
VAMSSPSAAVHGGSSLGPPVRCTLEPGNRLPAAVVIPVEHPYLDNVATLLYGFPRTEYDVVPSQGGDSCGL